MPLHVRGQLNDQFYDKNLPVKEYAIAMGIPELIDRPSINLVSTRRKPDKLNGGWKAPESLSLPTLFTAVTPQGNNIQIRYYERMVPKQAPGGGLFDDFQPAFTNQSKVPFQGSDIVINSISNLEIALYYASHTKCKNSPFCPENSSHLYEVYYPEKVARARATGMKRLIELQSRIFSMDERALRLAAKGVRIKVGPTAYQVHSVDSLTTDEVVVQMVELASRDLEQFAKQFESGEYKIYGFLNDAIDNGIITLGAPHSNGRSYVWGDNQETIVVVPHTANALAMLQTHFVSNMGTMMPLIKAKLEQKTASNLIVVPKNIAMFDELMTVGKPSLSNLTENSPPDDIFAALFKHSLIGYDPDDKCVRLIDKEGVPVKTKFVAKIDQETEWKKVALDRIKDAVMSRRAAALHLSTNI